MAKEDFIKIGKITSPRGLKGEVKIYLYTDIHNLEIYKKFYLEKTELIEITFHSSNKNVIIARIKNIEDRNSAEQLKNKNIYIKSNQLPKIRDKETFYAKDLLNLEVANKQGEIIGKIVDVTDYGAGDNLIIEFSTNSKIEEYPFLKSVFTKIDLKNKKIYFTPPEII